MPQHVVAAFAAFVRQRLAEVGGAVAPLLRRDPEHGGTDVLAAKGSPESGGIRHLAMVIVGAAAPFATTSHARARLLRQAHASGLLTARETDEALTAMRAIGAPRP
jgi:hypothetical protein